MPGASVTLLLCGDVMLGRGIDQLLPHPSLPALREEYLKDAREYVALAEERSGAIEKPVALSYVWGDALEELRRAAPDVRLVNLETSVTTSDHYWPGKGIHYRLHPANVGCLGAAGIDACALANNHVLDFGREGLLETRRALEAAGIRAAGAGRDLEQAREPAALPLPGGGTLYLFSVGAESSGIPWEWAAAEGRPGVALLPELSERTAEALADRAASWKRERGDLAVVSIHWGSNWGYAVPSRHVRFAHRLVERGVDVVHGHSSHHPRPLEVHRGKLILYGCGDFISDYEGIRGEEEFRGDLRPMYVARLDPHTGTLRELRVAVFQSRKLSLRYAGSADVRWLGTALSHAGLELGTRLVPAAEGDLVLAT